MTEQNSVPYVSIILTGRNDGYGGDFVTRFLATLQFNQRELANRRIAHEFVLVEWAPPPSAPLLADLVAQRCPAAADAVRSIVVDRAYHAALTQNLRLAYHEFLAKNVGLRRAAGTYTITTNCDVFFGRHILDRLSSRDLEPGLVYRAARWDLKTDVDYENMEWASLEEPRNLLRPGRRLRPPFFGGGTGDFIGLDRDSIDLVRGFNEVYRTARIGIDRNFLIQTLSCGLSIVDIGGPVYHVAHAGSFRLTKPQYAGREWEAPYGDERWPSTFVTYHNHASWGLRDAPSRVVGPRRTVLDFSWDAVPPLVDLNGVVLPVRRGGDGGRDAMTTDG